MSCPDVPSFQNDILPLFRPVDIDHMKPMSVFLDDYSWMSTPDNAQSVYSEVADGNMPPDVQWTQDMVNCFQKWMNTGYSQ